MQAFGIPTAVVPVPSKEISIAEMIGNHESGGRRIFMTKEEEEKESAELRAEREKMAEDVTRQMDPKEFLEFHTNSKASPFKSYVDAEDIYHTLFDSFKETATFKNRDAREYTVFIKYLKDNGFEFIGNFWVNSSMVDRFVNRDKHCMVNISDFTLVRELEKWFSRDDVPHWGSLVNNEVALGGQNGLFTTWWHRMADASTCLKKYGMATNYNEKTCKDIAWNCCMYMSLRPEFQDFNKALVQFYLKLKPYEAVIEKAQKFWLVTANQNGFSRQAVPCFPETVKDDRWDMYYGRDFPMDKMKAFMNDKTANLMMLHGPPGTGKSNLIKHLIRFAERDVLYIPPAMAASLASPNFVPFMLENKNMILLIEDGEEILSVDRNSATNNLLGITDGFLKDALDIKVICTFNNDREKIDEALLRKGRLHLEYEFRKLTVDELLDLRDFLEKDVPDNKIDKAMTLAEFFNLEVTNVTTVKEERKIGFGV